MDPDFDTTFEVQAEETGLRLDRFLADRLPDRFSRSYLAGLVRDGRVQVNGRTRPPSFGLSAGDRVEAELGEPPREVPVAEPVPLDVQYEDEHVVVLFKPAGLLVHPANARHGGTLVNGLLYRYPQIASVGVVVRPGIVHRLDRFTSGVMVVARSNVARIGLVQQFQERKVHKNYRAVVEGAVALRSDFVDLPIASHPKHHDRMRIDVEKGKTASTFYEVRERLGVFTELDVRPLTGRTHQIRLHLAHLGHPVVGDPLYGRNLAHHYRDHLERLRRAGEDPPVLDHQALHAEKLEFQHPVDGRRMSFTAPPPPEYTALLEELRAHRRD